MHSILAAARQAFADIEALLLPTACLACQRPLGPAGEAEVCCAVCRYRMRAIAPPTCGRCGQPLDQWEIRRSTGPASGIPGQCGFCRSWPDALGWAVSAVWLDEGPATHLAHALKYGGWRVAAAPMAEIMARASGVRLGGTDVLVPVPLGPVRERERGHNQAAELSRALGARLRVPVATDALVRVRETLTQTRLSPAERRRNVAGAFRAGGRRLEGLHIALVDDVLTTGATLAAAAEALQSSGAASVGAATFGRALVPQ